MVRDEETVRRKKDGGDAMGVPWKSGRGLIYGYRSWPTALALPKAAARW